MSREPGRAPETLTEIGLESHFGEMLTPDCVVPVEALTRDLTVGCVDGRGRQYVAAAPGGNAGLLILLLAAFEEETGRVLDDAVVDRLFQRYLDRFGAFYMHTDRLAQRQLARTLGSADLDPDPLLLRPPTRLRGRVLEALVEPAHLGCGHLRFMLEEPDAYGVRPQLSRAVIRAFFNSLWDGDPRPVLEILEGDHHERGVARIRTRTAGTAACLATACPHHGALELFLVHPDAAAALHTVHARFLADQALIHRDGIMACVERQRRLGDRHLDATLRRLAPDLPVFDIEVESAADDDLRIRVRRARGSA